MHSKHDQILDVYGIDSTLQNEHSATLKNDELKVLSQTKKTFYEATTNNYVMPHMVSETITNAAGAQEKELHI